MKIRCRLDFDVRRDLGLIDRVDPETGEVIKSAEVTMAELCRKHPDLRPCAKRGPDGKPFRWVEKRRGCIMLGGKRRCQHCVEVIDEK